MIWSIGNPLASAPAPTSYFILKIPNHFWFPKHTKLFCVMPLLMLCSLTERLSPPTSSCHSREFLTSFKKKKKKAYSTGYSQLFSYPNTSQARPCLASKIRWEAAHSGWYSYRPNQRLKQTSQVIFHLHSPLVASAPSVAIVSCASLFPGHSLLHFPECTVIICTDVCLVI